MTESPFSATNNSQGLNPESTLPLKPVCKNEIGELIMKATNPMAIKEPFKINLPLLIRSL